MVTSFVSMLQDYDN